MKKLFHNKPGLIAMFIVPAGLAAFLPFQEVFWICFGMAGGYYCARHDVEFQKKWQWLDDLQEKLKQPT